MDGLFLIDKPSGMSSFDVIRMMRKKFPDIKMGYLGTLDPLASGLLALFTGHATKLIRHFADTEKEYETVLELGKISDTFDATGKVMNCSVKTYPPRTKIMKAIQSFAGDQWQIQPSFSALHFHGRRAYQFAREGKSLNLGKRRVSFFELSLKKIDFPFLELRIVSSPGAYIRSFVHELGQQLKTGAILAQLQRTRIGPFDLTDAFHPETLSVTNLIPISQLVQNHLQNIRGFRSPTIPPR